MYSTVPSYWILIFLKSSADHDKFYKADIAWLSTIFNGAVLDGYPRISNELPA